MFRLLRRRARTDSERSRPHPLLRVLQAAWIVSLWSLIGAAVALAAIMTVPGLFGLRAFTVLTGSMEPTLEPGSVVINEPIRPREARPGDIVTFPDPARGNRLTTHRLQAMTVRGDKAFMVTRGDANDKAERWNVSVGDQIGRGVYEIPKVGYARALIGGKGGRIGVVAVLALWGVLALIEIWRPSTRKRTDRGEARGRASRGWDRPTLKSNPSPVDERRGHVASRSGHE